MECSLLLDLPVQMFIATISKASKSHTFVNVVTLFHYTISVTTFNVYYSNPQMSSGQKLGTVTPIQHGRRGILFRFRAQATEVSLFQCIPIGCGTLPPPTKHITATILNSVFQKHEKKRKPFPQTYCTVPATEAQTVTNAF
jgi:hypothetical protein